MVVVKSSIFRGKALQRYMVLPSPDAIVARSSSDSQAGTIAGRISLVSPPA